MVKPKIPTSLQPPKRANTLKSKEQLKIEQQTIQLQKAKEKSASQKTELNNLIKTYQDRVDQSIRNYPSYKSSKQTRRREQTLRKEYTQRIKILKEALKGLNESGGTNYYEDLNRIKTLALNQGSDIARQERRVFNDRAAKDKRKEEFAQSQGFKTYKELLANTSGVATTSSGQVWTIERPQEVLTQPSQQTQLISPTTKMFDIDTSKFPTTQQERETYSSNLNLFGSPSEPSGQATAVFRPPTFEEQKEIQSAKERGSFLGILSTPEIIIKSTAKKIERKTGFEFPRPIKRDEEAELKKLKEFKPINLLFRGTEEAAEGSLQVGEFFGGKISPKEREVAKDFLSTAYLFSFFSPAMQTATAQQSVYQGEVVEVIYNGKKVKMSLSEARAKGLTPLVSREAILSDFQFYPKQAQVKYIKDAFKNKVYVNDASKVKDIKQAMEFMTRAKIPNSRQIEILQEVFKKKLPIPKTESSSIQVQESVGVLRTQPTQSEFVAQQQFARQRNAQLKSVGEVSTVASATSQDFSQDFDQSSLTRQLFNFDTKQGSKQDSRSIQFFAQDSSQDSLQSSKQESKSQQLFNPSIATPTTTITNIELIKTTPQTSRDPPTKIPEEPKVPKKPVKGIPFFFPGETIPRSEQNIGYHAEVLEKGRWKKVTQGLHTRQGAMDVGSRIVDNTTSAQYRLVAEKIDKRQKPKKTNVINQISSAITGSVIGRGERPKKSPPLKQGDGYSLFSRNKFRDYKKSKGTRKKISNRFIEKKNRRLDTFGETRGLTVAQGLARQRRSMGFRI